MSTITVVLFAFVYFFLQGWAFCILQGNWRRAAWGPAGAITTAVLYDVLVTLSGSAAALIPLKITLVVCLLWVTGILLLHLRTKRAAGKVVTQ